MYCLDYAILSVLGTLGGLVSFGYYLVKSNTTYKFITDSIITLARWKANVESQNNAVVKDDSLIIEFYNKNKKNVIILPYSPTLRKRHFNTDIIATMADDTELHIEHPLGLPFFVRPKDFGAKKIRLMEFGETIHEFGENELVNL